ncbi:MAG: hypothetical protein GPOALKHO_000210 [Sodalis sp.]|nr:MAG: hypothetical protein GPOALKHO_000210 [Sodalis sp.]
MKILLVDNDQELDKMLSEYLTAESFDTSLALDRPRKGDARCPVIMLLRFPMSCARFAKAAVCRLAC